MKPTEEINSLRQRVSTMRSNVAQAQDRLQLGQITPTQFRVMKKDVTNRVAEINAEIKQLRKSKGGES